MLLIKLLYLADREALRRWGRPISRDQYVAMNNGPVLSRVLDLIRYGVVLEGGQCWTTAISSPQPNYEVRLLQSPPVEELSAAEQQLLDAVDERFGHWNAWRLVEWMHDPANIPEWSDPEGTSVPITYADILRAVGKSQPDIEQVESELASLAAIEALAGPC